MISWYIVLQEPLPVLLAPFVWGSGREPLSKGDSGCWVTLSELGANCRPSSDNQVITLTPSAIVSHFHQSPKQNQKHAVECIGTYEYILITFNKKQTPGGRNKSTYSTPSWLCYPAFATMTPNCHNAWLLTSTFTVLSLLHLNFVQDFSRVCRNMEG